MVEERETGGLSDDEIDAARRQKAVFVNRMIATNLPNGVRISFGESYKPDVVTEFSAGIFMSYEDAQALRDLIDRQLFLAGFGVRAAETGSGPDNK